MTNEDMMYLIIGVEDGWIEVNDKVWEAYEKARKVVKTKCCNCHKWFLKSKAKVTITEGYVTNLICPYCGIYNEMTW